MSVTAFSSGTQAATVTTEHFLANVNVAGVFSLHVDKNAMQAQDVLELRVYQMVLAAGTARPVKVYSFYGAQDADDQIAVSEPISNELTDAQALRFSLKQTFGTSRNFPWKVIQHA
jgi:hypothetical protein